MMDDLLIYFLLVLWLHKEIIADWIWNRECSKFNSYILSFHFLHNTEVFYSIILAYGNRNTAPFLPPSSDKLLVRPHFHTFSHIPTCRLCTLSYLFPLKFSLLTLPGSGKLLGLRVLRASSLFHFVILGNLKRWGLCCLYQLSTQQWLLFNPENRLLLRVSSFKLVERRISS